MITIVWDVDDVLNDLLRDWRARPGAPAGAPYDALAHNPPHEQLAISREAYLASLDAFREERYDRVAPLAETLAWFERHGDRARHVALTAVPAPFAHRSAEWVVRHYGRWIRTFAFTPSRGAGPTRPDAAVKTEYLRWLGKGEVYVDDREDNVRAVEALGLRGVLFPRPWNRARDEPIARALDRLTSYLS
jgi:hypothetical protein